MLASMTEIHGALKVLKQKYAVTQMVTVRVYFNIYNLFRFPGNERSIFCACVRIHAFSFTSVARIGKRAQKKMAYGSTPTS